MIRCHTHTTKLMSDVNVSEGLTCEKSLGASFFDNHMKK